MRYQIEATIARLAVYNGPMKCESCNVEHDGSYASGRFCSSKCARSFSTRKDRDEINRKVSATLKGRPTKSLPMLHSIESRGKAAAGLRAYHRSRRMIVTAEGGEVAVGTESLGSQARRAILFEEQKGACARCGNTHWMGEPITLELEHIDGDNSNNRRENLELLCPNCHSYTKTWRGRNKKKVKVVTDDELLQVICENGSIHKGLIAIGMAPKGRNYERCKRVMREKGVAMFTSRREMTHDDIRIAASLRSSGMTYQEVAWTLGFAKSTVTKRLNEMVVDLPGLEPGTCDLKGSCSTN